MVTNKIFKLLSEVLEDNSLTYRDKVIFTALLTFNGQKKIYPSHKEISWRTGCNSINNISVSISKLKNKKYIKVFRRMQKSNLYVLTGIETKLKIKRNYKPETLKYNSLIYSIGMIYREIIGQELKISFIKRLLKMNTNKDNVTQIQRALMICYVIKKNTESKEYAKVLGKIYNEYQDLKYIDFRNEIFSNENFIVLNNNQG